MTVVDEVYGRGEDEVAAGRLDVAVIATWGTPFTPPPQVSVHPLLMDPMVVVLPDDHRLVAGRPPGAGLRLEELRDECWVAIRVGHPAREQFDRVAGAAGFSPQVRFQTESYYVAQALIGTGVGVALVSRLALAGFPGTVHRELVHQRPRRQLHAVTPADTSLTPLVDVFLGLLRDVADDIIALWNEPPLNSDPSRQ